MYNINMKLIKITGAALLMFSGYLVHFFADSRLSNSGAIWLGLLIFTLVAIGLTAIFTKDTKSFKKHVKDILSGLPI